MTYDVENRLTKNTHSSGIPEYAYDGDGKRVKKVVTVSGVSTTTFYVGDHYEVTNGSSVKHYSFGTQRVAVKQGSTVFYLHGDHLGSTSVTTNGSGGTHSAQTYYAFGANFSTTGTPPTDFGFTDSGRTRARG